LPLGVAGPASQQRLTASRDLTSPPTSASGQTPTTATRPATATSAAASQPYPSPELTAACQAAEKDIRGELDETFNFLVNPPFVVAGNLPKDELASFARSCVTAPAEIMWRDYFTRRPEKPITILLFRDADTYKDWAKKLFDDADVSPFGYYKPDKRTMVMNIATGGGTLVHELTHALIVWDFPDVPQWFNEGLGSLHEGCGMRTGKIIGLVNWRLPALQKAAEEKKLRPLREMIATDDFYGEQRGLNYAQSRYLMMYLQQQGKLEELYRYYRDHHDGADAAVTAVETVTGKKIEQLEKDYLAWMMQLKAP
jgi:hypothetical protein